MILLDTHAWIWWSAESDKLSQRAAERIDAADGLGVSVLSCWEVGMLVGKGRLSFNVGVHQWINDALQRPKVRLIPLTPAIAVDATLLPSTAPGDPIDRMIIASCQSLGVPLVSKDEEIRKAKLVDVIW